MEFKNLHFLPTEHYGNSRFSLHEGHLSGKLQKRTTVYPYLSFVFSIRIRLLCLDAILRSSNRKELIQIKNKALFILRSVIVFIRISYFNCYFFRLHLNAADQYT